MQYTEFHLRYAQPSRVQADLGNVAVRLSPDGYRQPAFFQGRVRHPVRLREALGALYAVVSSDYRYKPKDRTAYYQYLQKKEAAATRAQSPDESHFRSQQQYLDWLFENDPEAWIILDPVISVHPDEAFFEVFSKDESTYAKLSVRWDMFEQTRDLHYGTTNIDFSVPLYNALQKIRSYKNTELLVDPESFHLKSGDSEHEEKKIRVPDSWLRGFLQVQSAATLPMTSFPLATIDLYNILFFLRRHREKKSPRGLRFELVPNEPPRIILEPWEEVLFSQAPPYTGPEPQVIRTWGRRRLMLLARLLPLTRSITVYTLGSGLPTFFVLDMEDMAFTLALSGWTANDWSASASFDLLLPRDNVPNKLLGELEDNLQNRWFATADEIVEDTGMAIPTALAALQQESHAGKLIYDLHRGVYRWRQLSRDPFDLDRLRFRNEREAKAHRFLGDDAESEVIQLTKINDVVGYGLELVGEVEDKDAYRTYRTGFFVDLDGRISRAKCNCPWYKQNQFREGPCEHMIALRLLHARRLAEQQRKRKTGEDRQLIVAETRTFSRRDGNQETLYQLSLDHDRLRIRWGQRGTTLRDQRLLFDNPEDARREYFNRIGNLETKGFIDARA